jgi:integrase
MCRHRIRLDRDDQIVLAREFVEDLTSQERLPYTLAIHSGRDADGDVGMTERLATALRKHRHLRHRRVLCKDDGAPLTRQGCWSRVRYSAHRAKVPTGVHILRHTFCSHLAMQGAPMRGVQELVGHQSLAMTQRYSHLSPAALDATIRLLENRHDVAGSWRQFGDAEGVECLT